MIITAKQKELIALLIDEAMSDRPALERRWNLPAAVPFAQSRAREGFLLLTRDWTEDAALSRDGEVSVIDTDGDLPVRLATEEERRVALFRSIAGYPELVPLLPSRPPEAITCSSCGGAGVHLERFANPLLRHLICACGGAGWTIDEVGAG